MTDQAAVLDTMRELERLYADRPSAYRRKVAGWVALGYGYIVFCLVLILGYVVGGALLFLTGTVSVIWVDNYLKAGIPLLLIAGLMIRGALMRLPDPAGIRLAGSVKEKMLAEFEPVRIAAGGRRVDEVLVTNELNAAVVQLPKYGLFGPTKNFLILGLPLLRLLTSDEVRAVIAHEFGHLSHGHGRMGSIVYRLDQTLRGAASAIHEKSKGGFRNVSFRFLDWFYRHFNTVTFAMRRGQEYEADKVAAIATSANALSSALCKLTAYGAPLDGFWQDLWRRSRTVGSATNVFPQQELRDSVLSRASAQSTADALDAALERQTDFADSHPCLRERLAALAAPPIRQFAAGTPALDQILTTAESEELVALVDKDWQTAAEANWMRANQEFHSAVAELAELRRRTDLDRKELLRQASLEENIEGPGVPVETWRRLAALEPQDAGARFHLGRCLLTRDRTNACEALLECVDLDPSYVPDVTAMLGGEFPDALRQRFADAEARFGEQQRLAGQERERIGIDDELVAVQLNDQLRSALQAFAGQYHEIRRLFLVEKAVHHFKHDRIFLLGFDVNTWHDDVERDSQKWLQRVTAAFAGRFPGLNRPMSALVGKKGVWADRLGAIEGALIYSGSGKSPRTTWQKVKLGYWLIVLAAVAWIIISGGE